MSFFSLSEICCQWIQWWTQENQEKIRTLSQPDPQWKPLWVEADRLARDPIFSNRQVVRQFISKNNSKMLPYSWIAYRDQSVVFKEVLFILVIFKGLQKYRLPNLEVQKKHLRINSNNHIFGQVTFENEYSSAGRVALALAQASRLLWYENEEYISENHALDLFWGRKPWLGCRVNFYPNQS